jgi:hypothetical protein
MFIVPLLKDRKIRLLRFFFINVLIRSIAYTPLSFMNYPWIWGDNRICIPKNSLGVPTAVPFCSPMGKPICHALMGPSEKILFISVGILHSPFGRKFVSVYCLLPL